METIEIQKDRQLNPGDRVLLHFKAPGADWLKATECAIIENRLQKYDQFMITSIDYWQPGKVIFEVEVLKTNPEVVTVLFIVSAILAAGAGFLAVAWLFEKAELIVTAPATKAISYSALIVVILIAISYLKKAS